MKRLLVAFLVAGLALAVVVVWMLNLQGEDKLHELPPAPAPTAQLVTRGAYLARVGNCMTCHTARGAAAYAGGRAIDTPFGRGYSSNRTPDADTGIGRWTADHFWRALHHGRSRDGRLLYPAFPYP
ncbi:MAG: cytochrome c, partial [Ramlibacter sp.]|nr:cytochrome c [Ramlibacter sp.]